MVLLMGGRESGSHEGFIRPSGAKVGGWNKRGRWGRRVREGVDPPLAPDKHFHGERSCRDKTQMPQIRAISRDETIGWLERMAVASK
jgi:hypothetical protein